MPAEERGAAALAPQLLHQQRRACTKGAARGKEAPPALGTLVDHVGQAAVLVRVRRRQVLGHELLLGRLPLAQVECLARWGLPAVMPGRRGALAPALLLRPASGRCREGRPSLLELDLEALPEGLLPVDHLDRHVRGVRVVVRHEA